MEEPNFEKKLTKVGLLQAYDYILHMLCKHGLPKNHIYEFAAYHMILFGKKWKTPKQSEQSGSVSLNKKMHNSHSNQNNSKRNIALHVRTKKAPSQIDDTEIWKGSDECARAQNVEAIGTNSNLFAGRVVDNDNVEQ